MENRRAEFSGFKFEPEKVIVVVRCMNSVHFPARLTQFSERARSNAIFIMEMVL